MKKFLALVLCLTLVLTCFTALFGCSESESGDTQGGNSVGALDNINTSEGDKEYEMLTRNECHKAFVRADAYGENVAKSADSYSEAIGRFIYYSPRGASPALSLIFAITLMGRP